MERQMNGIYRREYRRHKRYGKKVKWSIIFVIGEHRSNGTKGIFEEIIAENCYSHIFPILYSTAYKCYNHTLRYYKEITMNEFQGLPWWSSG